MGLQFVKRENVLHIVSLLGVRTRRQIQTWKNESSVVYYNLKNYFMIFIILIMLK